MVKGSYMTDESRVKMSIARMGRIESAETRVRKSVAQTGRIVSSETRAKESASRMGHAVSPEARITMSASHIGKPGHSCSLETRMKISMSEKGKVVTAETRRKMSAFQSRGGHWKGGKVVWKRKANAKRRLLGFNPLNSWFVGCDGHHTNDRDVIYMPHKLHCSIYHSQTTGKGMAEMNVLAGAFLTEDWT